MVYINHHLYSGDNGRVLGYDNAHNYYYRHYMGETEPVSFKSFEDIENHFQQEFEVIYENCKKSEYIINPGHGHCRIVKAVESSPIKLHVETLI